TPLAPGPALVADPLANRAAPHRRLEPAALRPPRDGPGGVALCPRSQHPGSRRTGDDGAPLAGLHDGHLLALLAVPPDRFPPRLHRLRRAGRPGLVVQVHHRARAADPGAPVVGRSLVPRESTDPTGTGSCGTWPGRAY